MDAPSAVMLFAFLAVLIGAILIYKWCDFFDGEYLPPILSGYPAPRETSATHTARSDYTVRTQMPPRESRTEGNVNPPYPTTNMPMLMPMPQQQPPPIGFQHHVVPYPPMGAPDFNAVANIDPSSYESALSNDRPSIRPAACERQPPYNPCYSAQ